MKLQRLRIKSLNDNKMSIDQGVLDSTSVKNRSSLACLVKKRMLDGEYFSQTSNIYVAKYLGRSLDVRDDYEDTLKLVMYYDARVNIEYTKIGIVQYFREKRQYHRFMKRPMIAMPSAGDGTLRRMGMDPHQNLIGTTVTPAVIDHQDGKIKEYIQDYYQFLFFEDMIEQLRDYDRNDRRKYDLVVAAGLCEIADEDLLGEPAKKQESQSKELKQFGYYIDDYGIKRFGVLPEPATSIVDQTPMPRDQGYRWVDSSGVPRFDDRYDIEDVRDLEDSTEAEI